MTSDSTVSYYTMRALGFASRKSFADSTILDCGCGFGRNAHMIRSFVDQNSHEIYLIGCDIFKEYLVQTKNYNPYDDLVLCDIKHLPFRFEVFDYIIASEVIEHLEKQTGLSLLKNLEKLCKGTIIVTTPYYPFEQKELRENPYEMHRSFWKEADFKMEQFQTDVSGCASFLEAIIMKLRVKRLITKIERILSGRITYVLVAVYSKCSKKTKKK